MIRAAARYERIAMFAAFACVLGACSIGSEGGSFAEQVGLASPPPDEYAVVANRELQMPASYDLPTPTPGAPSLVEARPVEEARAALFETEVASTTGPSAGEAALLAAAGADQAEPGIRQTVATEQDEFVQSGQRYGLTSIFGYKIPGAEDGEVLDADEESRRLAAEGLLSPIAPEAPDAK